MNTQGGWRTGLFGTALFYGSIWGLGEATLGHLLHLARIPGLPGLVMFPFAALVMGRAAARPGAAGAIFLTGAVAAAFKFLDLLVPGTDILAVINPAQAILLEALAGAAWIWLGKTGRLSLFLEPAGTGGLKNEKGPPSGRVSLG